MVSNVPPDAPLSRRSILAGMGGFGMLSISNVPTSAEDPASIRDSLETDPHTLDTYRSIVDALIPRTPGLADELGPEHEPGALDVEMERFLVYSFDNFHEIRPEMVTTELGGRLGVDFAQSELVGLVEDVLTGVTGLVRNLLQTFGLEALDGVFGALEGITVDVLEGVEEGGAQTIELTVETSSDVVHRVTETYPYAELFALVFDLVALEFITRGKNEDDLQPGNESFPAGGAFVWLSPRDRLRCLETIEDGGVLDDLDSTLGEVVPTLGILKFGVMAIVGFPMLGYYSEWEAYGSTKTDQPNDREVEMPVDQTQSRQQTGYPGFQPGYAQHMGFEVESFTDDWPPLDDGESTDGEESDDGETAGDDPSESDDADADDTPFGWIDADGDDEQIQYGWNTETRS